MLSSITEELNQVYLNRDDADSVGLLKALLFFLLVVYFKKDAKIIFILI